MMIKQYQTTPKTWEEPNTTYWNTYISLIKLYNAWTK